MNFRFGSVVLVEWFFILTVAEVPSLRGYSPFRVSDSPQLGAGLYGENRPQKDLPGVPRKVSVAGNPGRSRTAIILRPPAKLGYTALMNQTGSKPRNEDQTNLAWPHCLFSKCSCYFIGNNVMRRLGRVSAIPKNILIRTLAGKWWNFRHDARVASI
mgnify:CR=1 FL=1